MRKGLLLLVGLGWATVASAQQPVQGTKTNNAAAPGATNFGAFICVANAAAPTWTETFVVACSADLHGSTRVTLLDSGGTTMTDTTAHALKILPVDPSGSAVAPTTLGTQDTALGTITTVTGSLLMGRGSAAAPTAVSADDDATLVSTDKQGRVRVLVESGQVASGAIASGAIASGAVASGAFASGSVASGAIASGAVASGAFASGSVADGAVVTLGAKTDAKSTATDATSITIMQVLKELSAMAQSPAALPSNQSVNNAQVNGVTMLTGTGATGTGAQRMTVAVDSATVAGSASLPAGTNLIGAAAVAGVATTTNSGSTCVLQSAASTNATNCKGSAGNLYGYELVNTTATLYYLRMYNLATAPTCSSATGFVRTIPIPASATGAGLVRDFSIPEGYATGIGFCLTGGGSSTDNTNAATGVFLTLLYK